MTSASRQLTAGVLVILITLGLSAAPAAAQNLDRIPPEVLIATSLTPEQQQLVNSYITHWAQQLQGEEDAQVVTARRRLIEPLGGSGSEQFNQQYSQAVGRAIQQAAQAERLIVRLNTMIIVTRLSPATALPLIEQGLNDENAAVRYWAAKSVASITSDSELPPATQRQLLAPLAQQLGQESSVPVVQQVMLSLLALTIPEATQQVLEALNERVTMHMTDPGQSVVAESEGLAELYRKLVTEAGQSGARQEQMRQLARVALRYMDLVATQFATGNVPPEREAEYVSLLDLTSTVLNAAHQSLQSPLNSPTNLSIALRSQDWPAVQAQVEEWRNILRAAPFNIPQDQLQVAPAAQAQEPAQQ